MTAFQSEPPAHRISVVMATLDGAEFLEAQLDSIAGQTLSPLELIVGDDGSTDSTVDIVTAFAKRGALPVTLIENAQRLGATENFLALSMRSRGSLVAFCDQDDVWDARKLERTARWFADPRSGLVLHRALVVDESLRPLGRRFPSIGRTTVRRPTHVDPWYSAPGMAMVFRRSLLEVVEGRARPPGLDGQALDHDDWIYLLSSSLGRTVFLAEDLSMYRQHGSSYVGAPAASVSDRVARTLRPGAGDYRRRAATFRARRDFWLSIASDPGTSAADKTAAERAAAWCGHLASGQEARAGVHDDSVSRARRALRMAGHAIAGGYYPRTMGGLGAKGLVGDALGLLSGRSGSGRVAAPEAVVDRIVAERSAGRSAQAIAAALMQKGVPALYGDRWTAEMVRDVVFEARRAADSRAGVGGSTEDLDAAAVNPTLDER